MGSTRRLTPAYRSVRRGYKWMAGRLWIRRAQRDGRRHLIAFEQESGSALLVRENDASGTRGCWASFRAARITKEVFGGGRGRAKRAYKVMQAPSRIVRGLRGIPRCPPFCGTFCRGRPDLNSAAEPRLRMVMPQERDQNEHFRTVEEGEGLCSSPTASADRGRSLSCACVRKSRGSGLR